MNAKLKIDDASMRVGGKGERGIDQYFNIASKFTRNYFIGRDILIDRYPIVVFYFFAREFRNI